MKNKKLKCLDCPCLVICKFKAFEKLKNDCFYIVNFLYGPLRNPSIQFQNTIDIRFDLVIDIMNPPWKEDYLQFKIAMKRIKYGTTVSK